jgi:tRNA (cytidine/uridine-2'-O-)-methyltransferase
MQHTSTHDTEMNLKHITPMVHIVLFQPEIPPNTGNIIRLCANMGGQLHLIEPLGFPLDDTKMRRAGLDYHEYADMQVHSSWDAFRRTCMPPAERLFLLSSKATHSPYQTQFQRGDWLVFGAETRGVTPEVQAQFAPTQQLRLPMRAGQRCLNLSNSVAIVSYEVWRQLDFVDAV